MLTTVEKILRLRRVDLFIELTAEDLVPVAQVAEELEFSAGQEIFAQGDVGEVLYLILDGTVRVHRGKQELARLTQGECFGELSILDKEPRSASCTAETDLHLLALGGEAFSELLQSSPELARAIIVVLVRRLRRLLPP